MQIDITEEIMRLLGDTGMPSDMYGFTDGFNYSSKQQKQQKKTVLFFRN